jgi:hypothetical protein
MKNPNAHMTKSFALSVLPFDAMDDVLGSKTRVLNHDTWVLVLTFQDGTKKSFQVA